MRSAAIGFVVIGVLVAAPPPSWATCVATNEAGDQCSPACELGNIAQCKNTKGSESPSCRCEAIPVPVEIDPCTQKQTDLVKGWKSGFEAVDSEALPTESIVAFLGGLAGAETTATAAYRVLQTGYYAAVVLPKWPETIRFASLDSDTHGRMYRAVKYLEESAKGTSPKAAQSYYLYALCNESSCKEETLNQIWDAMNLTACANYKVKHGLIKF